MAEHERDSVLRGVQCAKQWMGNMEFLGNLSSICGSVIFHYLEDAFFCRNCSICSSTSTIRLMHTFRTIFDAEYRNGLQGPCLPVYPSISLTID
ncbi:hypothetical protein CDAR_21681 [Caerostris darwini]|uniref:Uncharacterized protein n=1 Tax=Caerostris darwini TaxID=1538125 RepID=A0AAV4VG12_9ARAC|nr:hypothetical protein CDAR_21681 [Caerostris darwini]